MDYSFMRNLLTPGFMNMLAEKESLIRQYAPMIREQERIIRQYAPMIRLVGEQSQQFLKAIRPLDVGHLLEQVAWVQEVVERDRVKRAFQVAGFVPSLSMDRELVGQVVEAHKNGEDGVTLAKRVLDFYDENSCERLTPIIEHLCASPDLDGRQDTLRHMLAAHRTGLDTITTYPLVAMIEGVLLPYLKDFIGPEEIKELLKDSKQKTLTHNTLAALLSELPAVVGSRVGWEAFECLLSFFEDHLYHFCDWTSGAEVRSNYDDLNRHSLLHGMVSQGTRLNTLRCVFILDLVAAFLPALREELGEGGHTSS